MDRMQPLLGSGKDTPKNWIRLDDLYADLTLLYMHEPSRAFFPEAHDGVEAVMDVIWQVLGSIDKIAVVDVDGKVQRIEADGITPADRSISLSHGTIGTDPAKDILLDRGQCSKVLEEMAIPLKLTHHRSTSTGEPIEPGRPSKRLKVAAAYRKEYPEGHETIGDSWKVVINKVCERLGEQISVDTLKRALGKKK